MRMIFSTVFGPQEPALTVGSFAIRATGRPPTVAMPVTTPSAPKPSCSQFARRASSEKESASTRRATRSRTGSLPWSRDFSWCRSGPPPRARSSASFRSDMSRNLSGRAKLRAQCAPDQLQADAPNREAGGGASQGHSERREQRGAHGEQPDDQAQLEPDQYGGDVARFHAGSVRPHGQGSFPLQYPPQTMSLVMTEDRGAVRHIVINRPEKRNALNGDTIRELGGAIEAAAADDSVRVVVVRGEGAMFSSGMDLNDLRSLSESPENLRSYRRPILSWWNLLEEMPKPTICQIHGAALGGAFELALACDFRTMAEDAVAGIMEVRVGLLPDVGGCSRLPALVGLGNAKELIMTGKVIDGREAHRIGFANRIGPADQLDSVTDALATELLACAPRAVGLAKRVLDAAAKPALALTLEQEVAAQETLAASEDFAEGARAFFEKRDPDFAGR